MMNLMTQLIGFYKTRWFRTFLAALFVAAIVWVFGPLLGIGQLHPLDGELARIILIVVIFVGWIVENLIHNHFVKRREKKLAEAMVAQEPGADATASAEEMAALAERLKDALAALKKAKLGGRGRYLYQLPWYMFIGPPGAGKTTALVNAGLKFPLADTHGPEAVRGVGGTRNCDWWFTDEAVLIDTAGRYTTQDSNAAVDSSSWLGFLRMLKQNRTRQPLNGVLVAISLSDLASLNDSERSAHAQAIRRRIRELHDQLGIRIPAYVLFTKADLLAGFVEFFGDLGKEEREQVWGATFKFDAGKDEGGAVAAFAAEFDALQTRINDRMLERIQQEPDVNRRRLIYSFPQQFASLRDVAVEFLNEVFRPSRLEARPLLRGAYFTSGTQDGTPIDRLLGAMAGQFGLSRQAVTAFSGGGRSYFLNRLMKQVVFGEAGLVSLDPRVERRQRMVRYATYGTAVLVLLILSGLWAMSWTGNEAIIRETHAAALKYEQEYADIAKRGAQDTDLRAILPALATLRSLPGGYEHREEETPVALTFGLYQGAKLTSAAIESYHRALNALLLPRLLSRLERQIQAHLNDPDVLYEALKVYLILGRQGPLDRDLVEQWLAADFNASFPGDEDADVRTALLGNVHSMLERPLQPLPLNGPLVAEARAVLTRQPLSEYIYNRLLKSAVIQSLPAWTVADNAGPGGGRVFVLRDGKSLNAGVPGIFTYDGYHTVFLPLLPRVTKDVTEDSWVLGRVQKGGLLGSVKLMSALRRDILSLYLDDYTQRWDALLANVALKPFNNLQEGRDELFLLSAPDSPLRDLLTAIDGQTQLTRGGSGNKLGKKGQAKIGKVGKQLGGFGAYLARSGLSIEENQAASIIAGAFGSDASGKPIDPAQRVDDHFKSLHLFVTGTKENPAPLEGVIAKLQQIYAGLNQAANAPNQGQALLGMVGAGAAGGGGGVAGASAALADAAKGAPKPIAEMLQTVSASSSQVTSSGATMQLMDAWRSKVLPLCQEAFNRYPFIAGSSQDVPLDDFTHLLGPNGLMDQFFNTYLKPLVDTTVKPWHWQAGGSAKLGLSPQSLAEFERAGDIRDALWPNGGSQILVKFQLVPTQLDPGIAQITIDIGGQRVFSYAHGPVEPMPLQWPASNGATQIRVTMTPAGGGAATVIEENGPWALLRLMDAAHVTQSGQPDKFHIGFSGNGGQALFELDAASVRNPFTLGALRSFRCPAKL